MKTLRLLLNMKWKIHTKCNKLKNHPSIEMVVSKINPNKEFSFLHNEILKQIENLDNKNAIQ